MASTLPVVEHFHSIQGEGAHVGKSAFFIRLASCKVACPWCDTKNSWSIEKHPKITDNFPFVHLEYFYSTVNWSWFRN